MKQNKGKQTVYDSQLLVKSYKILKTHFRGIWWNEVDRTYRSSTGIVLVKSHSDSSELLQLLYFLNGFLHAVICFVCFY